MSIRLRWTRQNDQSMYGSVIGDPESIRDLYWQLTHNYAAQDGTEIGKVEVFSLDGTKYTHKEIMQTPHMLSATSLLET